jgi:hypothetical protein
MLQSPATLFAGDILHDARRGSHRLFWRRRHRRRLRQRRSADARRGPYLPVDRRQITGASVAALFLVLGFDDGGLRATVICEKIGPSAGSRVQLSRAISGRRERPRGRRSARLPLAARPRHRRNRRADARRPRRSGRRTPTAPFGPTHADRAVRADARRPRRSGRRSPRDRCRERR